MPNLLAVADHRTNYGGLMISGEGVVDDGRRTRNARYGKSRRLLFDYRGLTYIGISWLRVSGTTKMPQIDHGVRHQLQTVMALLFELKAQQQPFEFILPCEGPLHT